MDWASQMAMVFPNTVAQHQQEDEIDDNDEDEDEDEDFYGDDATGSHGQTVALPSALDSLPTAGQTSVIVPPPVAPPSHRTVEQSKTENQTRAQELRAKLIARRQHAYSISGSHATTPVSEQVAVKAAEPRPQQSSSAHTVSTLSEPDQKQGNGISHRNSGLDEIEALIVEGKAAAQKQAILELKAAFAQLSNGTHGNDNEASAKSGLSLEENQNEESRAQDREIAAKPISKQSPDRNCPASLSDPYYEDLALWLDLTGFHDVAFRTAQLARYKRKQALQDEMARIQEQLAELDQAEQNTFSVFRFGTPSTKDAAPSLPSTMPVPTTQLNGSKREHSPGADRSDKRSKHDSSGFCIPGANASRSETRPLNLYRRTEPSSPVSLGRRIDFRGSHYRSDNFSDHDRDPSLERRQAYYGRREEDYRTDRFSPRGSPPQQRDRATYGSRGKRYRGRAGPNLRKGG